MPNLCHISFYMINSIDLITLYNILHHLMKYVILLLYTCIGPRVMRMIRSDIDLKYRKEIGDGVMSNYLYHCNAQYPT